MIERATSDMSCCKCNRSGRCRNCSCVKGGKICQGCLPQRLGHCANVTPPFQRLQREASIAPTAPTVDEIVAMPSSDVLSQSVDESHPNIDITWPPPALQPPNFMWGSCNGEAFCTKVNLAYKEVVHWRRNLFQVPSGSTGKAFVSELARLFQAYADNSSLEGIAMKATTLMQILLLQKPSRTSKSKDHVAHLQRRMELWLYGDIQALLDEGKCIQRRLGKVTSPSNNDNIARIFRDLMLQGKVQGALRYLSKNTNGGVLKLEDLIPETTEDGESILRSTRDVLKEKHPLSKDPEACSLVEGEPEPVNPILFDGLDADDGESTMVNRIQAIRWLGCRRW